MNYLVSKFACVLSGKENFNIYPYTKYCIENDLNKQYLVFGNDGEIPFVFNFKDSQNVLHIYDGFDDYFYLIPSKVCQFSTDIKFLSRMVNINIGTKLIITIDGEKICDKFVSDIEYSHFEIRRNYLIVYFKGKREYVVIIREKTLLVASHYDEINIVDGELIFMCKCNDCLRQGKVYYLNKNYEYESYLVYIDKKDIIIKDEFLPSAFLDAMIAGNLKFANNLLSDELKLKDEKGLLDFFNEFDEYLPLTNKFALIKKNTLAGICQFQIENGKIANIIV